eukprot:CAMPEP_0201646154 /NCGR_PEP_ID=MMETSP0493-20130528/33407_1 /ASSEMBLY_ACC=CAM_ASM_000838 /TAXON_ID=420259 /ORGANISM="Thalassiosira gravida, Strain GMp14c1" /LENGTH=137 /DNA_ID=CAMNT_0048121259 /DNA_START=355 /DNA_END=768 /DNA_ORIENTATION=+
MTLLAAIVTTLVASWLDAIGGDMPRISTIETTTVRILLLQNGIPCLTLGLVAGAIARKVTLFTAVVARSGSIVFLAAGTLSSSSAATGSSATTTAVSGRLGSSSVCGGLFCGFGFLGHDFSLKLSGWEWVRKLCNIV